MNFSKKSVDNLQRAWWILLLTYSGLFILVGVDKFFNILVDWQIFVSQSAQHIFFNTSSVLIRLFAVIQIIAGVFLFISRSRAAVYCILALLLFIFFNLWSMMGFSVVMVHDLFMIIHCIVLLWLTEVINSLKIKG